MLSVPPQTMGSCVVFSFYIGGNWGTESLHKSGVVGWYPKKMLWLHSPHPSPLPHDFPPPPLPLSKPNNVVFPHHALVREISWSPCLTVQLCGRPQSPDGPGLRMKVCGDKGTSSHSHFCIFVDSLSFSAKNIPVSTAWQMGIYLFIHQNFIECLLCSGHCSKYQGYCDKQERE